MPCSLRCASIRRSSGRAAVRALSPVGEFSDDVRSELGGLAQAGVALGGYRVPLGGVGGVGLFGGRDPEVDEGAPAARVRFGTHAACLLIPWHRSAGPTSPIWRNRTPIAACETPNCPASGRSRCSPIQARLTQSLGISRQPAK